MLSTGPSVTIHVKARDMRVARASWERQFIHHAKSGSAYTISQHREGWWACGCRGWVTHRKCRHLDELGLPPYETIFTSVKVFIDHGD